jgi:hypothetical protein
MYTIVDGKNIASYEIRKPADLKPVSTAALVDTYNELTGKTIKKFSDRKTAERRVAELIAEVDSAPEVVPLKSENTGRKSVLNKSAVIRLTTAENPKRWGTQAYANFEKYEDGITIEDLQMKGVSLADIRWNIAKEFIRLEE